MSNKNATKAPVSSTSNEQPEVQKSALELAKEQFEQAKQMLKDAKAQAKGTKEKKEIKGTMVKFKNQAGEEIIGKGVLYYVVRHNGKLVYKESSAVHVMTPEEIAEYTASQK